MFESSTVEPVYSKSATAVFTVFGDLNLYTQTRVLMLGALIEYHGTYAPHCVL